MILLKEGALIGSSSILLILSMSLSEYSLVELGEDEEVLSLSLSCLLVSRSVKVGGEEGAMAGGEVNGGSEAEAKNLGVELVCGGEVMNIVGGVEGRDAGV